MPELRFSMSKPKTQASGCLDDCEFGVVTGWLFDPTRPAGDLTVELLVDGKSVGTAVANEFRPDLKTAGMGDGHHSFRFDLPRDLLDRRMHVLEARDSQSGLALRNSPFRVVLERRIDVPGEAAAPARIPLPPGAQVLPDDAMYAISVIIVTRDPGAFLERVLRASVAAASGLYVELIVVDCGSSAPEEFPREFPAVRWRSAPGLSPGAARNLGVSLATHELLLFQGDTVEPASDSFYRHHLNAHRMMPSLQVAIAGKLISPEGRDRYGQFHSVPYTWLDWRGFRSENVSLKRSSVADWLRDGFRDTGLEDREFAFRHEGLRILYHAGAAAKDLRSLSVRQSIDERMREGMKARAFLQAHPQAAEALGLHRVAASQRGESGPGIDAVSDLVAMVEGAKAWAVVIDTRYNLGSQNWHEDLLAAVLELSFTQGYILASAQAESNVAAAYQCALERFQERMAAAASYEVFGRFPGFTLT